MVQTGVLRIKQGFDVGIVFGSAFDAAGGAERGDQRILPLHIAGALEEFNILWDLSQASRLR